MKSSSAVIDSPVAKSSKGNETATQQQIEKLIEVLRNDRRKGAEAFYETGKHFSELRDLTKPYEKDKESGLSYRQSVEKTGFSRGTAERRRVLYETVTAAKITADIYICLADHGCDLAANRTITAAGIVHEVPELLTLDVTNSKAVTKMVEKINDDYPVEGPSKPEPTPMAAMEALKANLLKQPQSQQRDEMVTKVEKDIQGTLADTLLTLATALAPFIGKDAKWATSYVDDVMDNATLLRQRYDEAVAFAKSATFLLAKKESK